ncbi:hypothetical protein RCL1_005173 [Eukaryota sp. TZLM3-RCL]
MMGLTYALSYFGKYSVNMLNSEKVQEMYDFNDEGYGEIITAGFWVYAFFIMVNGFLVDKIGPRKGVLMGSLGCSLSNLGIALYLQFTPWRQHKFVAGLAVLVVILNYFQTFSACAIVKCGSYWYNPRERGFFGSVFGVIIAFGFFLAFQLNGMIAEHFDPHVMFYNPGISLGIMFFINLAFVRSKPTDVYELDSPLIANLYDDKFRPSSDLKEDSRTFVEMVRPVLGQGIFYVFFLAEFLLGWFRDGILSWFSKYFTDHLHIKKDQAIYTLASSGLTIGSMFGSLFAGIVSDLMFKSRRQPVAFIGCVMVSILLGCLYFFIDSAIFGPVSLAFTAIFYQGIHGILTATCSMDFAGSSSVGVAVGLLDASQKVGSSLTGSLMAALISEDDGPKKKHIVWARWPLVMIPASVACAILFLFIMNRKATQGKIESKDKSSKTSLLAGMEEEEVGLNNSEQKI